jgi:hypothetical protein
VIQPCIEHVAALVAPRPLAILGAGLPDTRDEARRSYFTPLPHFAAPEKPVSPEALAANYQWTSRFCETLSAQPRFSTGPQDLADWFARNF